MTKLISCCGLDCGACDARTATLKNDDELRKATAEQWQKQFNAPLIPFETINCTGCREEGVKFIHCLECGVRKCADEKGFRTCAECPDLEKCERVGGIHKFVPEALENLKSLIN
jgi:hypothetical protein